MDRLLTILDNNARLSNAQIAAMLGVSEAEVAAKIEKYEQDGVIRGYKAIIDWDRTNREYVCARIEVKVIPQRDHGFDEIARSILAFDEVETLYLMSGGYDLGLTVSGKTFKDIALFVAKKLAPLDAVQSTATHFVLTKYKFRGIVLADSDQDLREATTL